MSKTHADTHVDKAAADPAVSQFAFLATIADEVRPMQNALEAGGHLIRSLGEVLLKDESLPDKVREFGQALVDNAPGLVEAVLEGVAIVSPPAPAPEPATA